MSGHFTIRPLKSSDKEHWLSLWRGYISFYQATVSDDVTEVTWARLLDEMEPNMFGLVAVDKNDKPMGMVNCILHQTSWSNKDTCYLQDLFVNPRARGGGLGRALIERVFEIVKEEGWFRVYWTTKEDNTQARALYEKLTPPSGFIRYDLNP